MNSLGKKPLASGAQTKGQLSAGGAARSKVASTADLKRLQAIMAGGLMRPLGEGDRTLSLWSDGRRAADVVAEFIAPNDRLSSLERFQIYNRMYWYRLLDNFRSDAPGLLALLGERKFDRLARAYLARYPSRSFTLRNLCSRLERFIGEEPALTAPLTAIAREVARFEWAQTVAFDGEEKPVLTAAEIAAVPPSRLRLGLQPYVTLAAFRHPVDDWAVAAKQRDALRAEASNAVGAAARKGPAQKRLRPPRPMRVFSAIHRFDHRLFHKRLDPAAYRILKAIQAGRTLSQALATAGRRVKADQVQGWFTTWMALGWFCRRN
jgi:hypothetical protein